jgi:purine nucleosidase
MSVASHQLLIDTDPGQDDAFALLLALASPEELEVLGITCVAGNAPVEKTTRNALQICELAGRREIPVYAGCHRPLTQELVTAEEVHGASGLDGATLPEPTLPLREVHAVDFLIETLRAEPVRTVTLVTLGPLTNVATALRWAPDIAARVRELVMMGGAFFEPGNSSPVAEFNIWVDPEAARIVCESGIPLVMAPLDVTHRALTPPFWKEAVGALPAPLGPTLRGWIDFYERYDRAKYGWDGGPMHDPCTIAYLLRPELFCGRRIPVQVETEGTFTRGMTVADWWHTSGLPENALFLTEVNREGFFRLLYERLARLG